MEQQMISHEESRAFLWSQFRKGDSLEQLKNIEENVRRALDDARIFTIIAGKHECGDYNRDYSRNYTDYKLAYQFYRKALKSLGDAHSIADYFAIHFLCNGHDNIPYCFKDYLFEKRSEAKENYLTIKKWSKKVLHKAAKLRIRGKIK